MNNFDILIVDDSPELVEILSFVFTRRKLQCVSANSKCELMRSLGMGMPALILLDVMLDGDDGRDICRNLKMDSSYGHVPIILISASTSKLAGFRDAYADDVIEKPIDFNVLFTKISRLLPTC